MCLDALISAGVGAGGALLSANGAANNSIAQDKNTQETAIDNTAAANASNAILQKYLTQQSANQATNQATLQPEYAAIQPGAFQASQNHISNTNNAAAQAAITGTLAGGGPQVGLTNTDNGQSAAAIQSAIGARTQLSRNDAANYAKLAAYGQNFGQLGLQEMNTNEGIDQTNTQARAQTGILPTDEANAALQARRFIPPADVSGGNTQIGLGNLLASNAGGIGTAVGKAATSLGSLFNQPSTTNPTINTGSNSGGIGMQ